MLTFTEKKRLRKRFGWIPSAIDIPSLIAVQKDSFDRFLQGQEDVHPDERQDEGLQGVLKAIFPVEDYSKTVSLEFVRYHLGVPKYDVTECFQRDATFAAPLRVDFRLVLWEKDEEIGVKNVKDIKEQTVYMGDLPLMTERGTFVFNGTERVIVSQMHRSPGVFFDHDKGRTHASGKLLHNARIIPYRGSWLDFEFDHKDLLFTRIDRRRRFYATTLLRALGLSSEEMLNRFYDCEQFRKQGVVWEKKLDPEQLLGSRLSYAIRDPETGKEIVRPKRKISSRAVKRLQELELDWLEVSSEELIGRFIAKDFHEGEKLIACAGEEITEALLVRLEHAGVDHFDTLFIDHVNVGAHLRNTLMEDSNQTREETLFEIYRVLRPGEPPTKDAAEKLFDDLFFNALRYDLSAVGRLKLNKRLQTACPMETRVLRKEDIFKVVEVLLKLKDGHGRVDDIDHLGNRRIRSVGELLENQLRIGLMRMDRAVGERMSSSEVETLMPRDVVSAKPFSSIFREFFGSSQLSQFMDQTNPLSEITHKRRLSALGPGGMTRERAGFEVRDVHPTHYGRICPIETPEGPNIGLINSLATYAQINQYGFIEGPYRRVKEGVVTGEVVYLDASEEEKHVIAQANAKLDASSRFQDELVQCRHDLEFSMATTDRIEYIDVSPKQTVSVAAALIPFLENDDANRALMGSNMQRQAVPLLRAEAPLVGTGMESVVARDSGTVVIARRGGVVDQVDAERIVIKSDEISDAWESGVDIYSLIKFTRSNQNTCINQVPLVHFGDRVEKGDIIADGPSTELGELALGKNVLVAFMPWNGYNFEDSIIISERIVKDDVFTSIHIEVFNVMARDTKLGREELTRDIPNIGESALRNLDDSGVIVIGSDVRPGDILVGKVTPKGETQLTPEEKLLRAIFGEKASDVRDTSLRLPSGVSGTVIDVRCFSRRGVEKDGRSVEIDRNEAARLRKDLEDKLRIIERDAGERVQALLIGAVLKSGRVIDEAYLMTLSTQALPELVSKISDDGVAKTVERVRAQVDKSVKRLRKRFEAKLEKLEHGDELPTGVFKMVKVYIAIKRRLQPGDKMAGRHGNKGVISKIIPVEDMPYLEDGTPVDIILNPLGVPSRMNVGQILETHLGWAVKGLGKKIGDILKSAEPSGLREGMLDLYENSEQNGSVRAMDDRVLRSMAERLVQGIPVATPIFDGASESEIVDLLERAGLPSSGQMPLIDGRTGEYFYRPVTVGYIYMLKLHHLVDDKIHARSIGPYSLVTQQPLGGKAQFGGQRFGEMEVWALEAYGASYTLQEMLTVKSDDVAGRTRIYESIVKNEDVFDAGVPESFNVLVKELQSLALDVDLIQRDPNQDIGDNG